MCNPDFDLHITGCFRTLLTQASANTLGFVLQEVHLHLAIGFAEQIHLFWSSANGTHKQRGWQLLALLELIVLVVSDCKLAFDSLDLLLLF
jgi:hypothetical protein